MTSNQIIWKHIEVIKDFDNVSKWKKWKVIKIINTHWFNRVKVYFWKNLTGQKLITDVAISHIRIID